MAELWIVLQSPMCVCVPKLPVISHYEYLPSGALGVAAEGYHISGILRASEYCPV